MKLKITHIIIVFQCCFGLYSQSNVGAIDKDLSLRSNGPVYALSSFDNRDNSLDGSTMVFEKPTPAKIGFRNSKELPEVKHLINVDQLNKNIIFSSGARERSVPLGVVEYMIFEDREFIMLESAEGEFKLFEYLVKDNLSLLCNVTLEVLKPYYNAATDVGSLRPQIKRKETFYLFNDNRLTTIPKKSKKLKNVLTGFPRVASYLQKNKVNLKSREDLKASLIINNKK